MLGGLRRCEVLGLDLVDVGVVERRVFVADGKGRPSAAHTGVNTVFATLGRYLDRERPMAISTSRVFVVLKDSRRGRPLSAYGLDEIRQRSPPPWKAVDDWLANEYRKAAPAVDAQSIGAQP